MSVTAEEAKKLKTPLQNRTLFKSSRAIPPTAHFCRVFVIRFKQTDNRVNHFLSLKPKYAHRMKLISEESFEHDIQVTCFYTLEHPDKYLETTTDDRSLLGIVQGSSDHYFSFVVTNGSELYLDDDVQYSYGILTEILRSPARVVTGLGMTQRSTFIVDQKVSSEMKADIGFLSEDTIMLA